MQAFDLGCCCGEETPNPCILLTDNWSAEPDSDSLGAEWDERAGDWDIVSGVAKYNSGGGADAFVISTVTHTDAQMHVQATMSSSTSGTTFRLILGYIDDNNYYYAAWRNHATTGTLKLFSRIAGVETELDTVDADIPTNTNCLVTVCCDGLFLSATVSGGGLGPFGVDYVGETLTGGGFGFGIEGTPGGTVRVTNFQAEKVESGCAACDPATEECEHCADGDSPTYILAELTGFTDDACTDCEVINGGFIASGGGEVGGTPVLCKWFYNIIPGSCGGDRVQIEIAIGTATIVVTISSITIIGGFITDIATFTLSISTPYDCLGIAALDIPFDSFGAFGACGGTVTCTLTAL